ncbi:succinylglutamate desuccinylase/aspartoacylase family protein [Candidatus Gracilibacteria bacterium]|nr:succinylglutamate desuccinylase/aspartoacylase family protein [Candidatus Gracilibacteria bacterium]
MKPQETLDQLSNLGQNLIHPTGAPYTWQIKSPNAGPKVTVFGAVHGNETTGMAVLNELLQTEIQSGTLNLAVGNPAAFLKGTRGTDTDLNRCFGQKGQAYEHARASKLSPILEETDVLIDLHSTIKPSDPFLVVAGIQHQLAHCIAHLGVPFTLTGKGVYAPDGSAICTDTYTALHGGLGITIEAGWLQDPKTADIKHGVIRALTALGLLKSAEKLPEPKPLEIIDCYQAIAATSHDFAFTKDWQNFEFIPASTVFAHDGDIALSTTKDSKIIFPKSGKLIPSTIACILAA